MVAAAVNGDDLTFTVGEGVMVNDANVILADVMASNGIIHVIDKVLMPPVPITEADGDICYNMYTHTIAAGASFDECMSYALLCRLRNERSNIHRLLQPGNSHPQHGKPRGV